MVLSVICTKSGQPAADRIRTCSGGRLEWIRTGMEISAEEMATIYSYIGTRSMWDMLDELR